jgi:transposase
MANRLSMAQINAIFTLHASEHSNREIGRLLGLHRETVGKYLAAQNRPNAPTGSGQEAGNAPTGSEGNGELIAAGSGTSLGEASLAAAPQNRPNAPTGSVGEVPTLPGAPWASSPRVVSGPPSECASLRPIIEAKLQAALSAKRIHQDLVDEHGFTGKYWSVRRYVARLRKRIELPCRRLETLPGEEAQVDFGSGAPVIGADGKRRRPWIFRIVLSHSRKAYSEAVWRQSSDAFIHCLENAFAHFGGVPKRLVIDNLKAAVARADWYDPEVHPKLQSFAAHYGTVFLPTKPYTPRHKGKVESGVKYVKRNALAGRTFTSLEAQNAHLLDWETRIADTRIHGTTKQQVARLFEEQERGLLLPLPTTRFPSFHEALRVVHLDGHIEVESACYSAPPEYVGCTVWARWDGRLVRVFNERWEQVAVHAKAEPGRFRTASEHIPREKVSAVERGTDALLRQIASIGQHTRQWAEATTQARGIEAVRVLVGLKALAGKHRAESLERACQTALAHRAYRLRTIRELLKRQAEQQQQSFEFLQEHPLIRPLSDYSLASLQEFRKERPHDERQVV